MINTLRRITQAVAYAPNLSAALKIIVQEVKASMDVTVCSVYLTHADEDGEKELVLLATEGLSTNSVGKVRMKFTEGLAGLVAERAEPINLDNAPKHPRYKYFSESGEKALNGFLGVPIINYGDLQGVLVVQQHDNRRFEDEHVAFLLTLAARLAGAISQAGSSEDLYKLQQGQTPRKLYYEGLPSSPGVVLGTAVVAYPSTDLDSIPDRPITDSDAEVERFNTAVIAVRDEMRELNVAMQHVLPAEESALFEAFALMLESGSLIDDTISRIRVGNWACGALRDTIHEHTRLFREMPDPYLRDRADDIRDLGRRIIMKLQAKDAFDKQSFPDDTILVGEEITASQLAEVPTGKLRGVVSLHGSSTSHVAIVAAAMQVPAIMGVTELPINVVDGKPIVVDGYGGRVYVQPNKTLQKEFKRLIREEQEISKELESIADLPAETTDGHRISLFVNAGLLSDITPSISNHGAEGIGLYRTEIPFQIRSRFPGEEEQMAIYREALEACHPRPVVLRTLDIGGDKGLDYFPIEEENPFLGWRGIRVSLDHPDIFLTQIRAMLKANENTRNLQILLPMISGMSELRTAITLIKQAHQELKEENYTAPLPPIGTMIEVPSSVYMVGAFSELVDYFSIGSNDLTQYLLAVDRNNERVGKLYDSFHPSVLSAILHVVQTATIHKKPVSICGELAGDPLGALLLLGMGLDSLSMNVGSLLRVKRVIRSFSKEEAIYIMSNSLTAEDGAQVREMLTTALNKVGLGGLLRAGR